MKKTKDGLYIGDTWETFLAQRDRLPNWKIPLSIAAVLHLVVFAGAAVLPDVGKKPELDNVITIDLLSLPSVGPASVAVQRQVAPRSRSKKQVSAPQEAKVAQKVVQEEAERAIEPPAPKIAEVAEQAPALPVVVPKKTPKVEPQPISPPEPVVQAKPVSLRPLKRKKKLVEDVRLAEVKEREERDQQEKQQAQQKLQQERERLAALEKKRLAEQRKQEKAAEQERKLAARKKKQQEAEKKKRLADQRRKEKAIVKAGRLAREAEQEAEQARLEAAQVRREYASVSQAVSDLNTPLVYGSSGYSSGGHSGSSGLASSRYGDYGGERGNPAVINQYAISLNGQISSHWQLPDIVKEKSNLRTEVALILRRDGAIEDMRIERKSGDSFFDQSVMKALRNSAPLPGFPALMNQRTQEFVLNFTPQGLTL